MPLSFTEETALERGFAALFQDEIAPKIEALQAGRSGLREGTLRQLKLLAGATAGLMLFFLVLSLFGVLPGGWLVLLPIAATGFGVWLVWWRQQAFSESVIDAVMPSFCRFLGDLDYRRRGTAANHVDPFEALGLVGVSNTRQLEHFIAGLHRGTGFDLVHGHLSHKSGGKNRTTSTVFQGLLFRIEVPTAVPIAIVIMPRLSSLPGPLALLQRRANDKLPEIAVDQPAFAAKFVVRADLADPADAAAVRAFLTPAFMAALLAIDEAEAKRSHGLAGLSAGFAGDTFYLALSRQHLRSLGPIKYERPKGFLEAGWFLRRDLDLEGAIHGMFKDVGTAHRVIDHLHGLAAAPGMATRAAS
jgi:hypothetical protein